MPTRRTFLGTLAGGLLAAPLGAEAQQTGTLPRIGLLIGGAPSVGSPYLERVEAFRQGLRELGYVEGKNLAIEYRWAEGKPERFPDFVADLVRHKVDVIVAHTTPAALAAKSGTEALPIVMVIVADPVGSGLVQSLGRPGGNITGLSYLAADLGAKQLALLKEAVPKISRVGVLRLPANAAHTLIVRGMETVAQTLRVTLQILDVRVPDDLDSAFATISKDRVGGVIVLPDPMFILDRARIADLAAKHRLPSMYGVLDHAAAGGLMAYAADDRDNWRRAATYVAKILTGAKPADLPIEQPTKFELVINMKTAKALGLTIPQSFLARADQVIE